MAGCRIVNAGVEAAVQAIEASSTQFKSAGENFISDLNSAISEMEGETKDALKKFIDGDVNDFVAEGLPDALTGMANLLEQNRTQFVETDFSISESIGSGS